MRMSVLCRLSSKSVWPPPRRMPPTARCVLPPIRRELHASYRLLPRHSVAKPSFRPAWHQQRLTEAQRAFHDFSLMVFSRTLCRTRPENTAADQKCDHDGQKIPSSIFALIDSWLKRHSTQNPKLN